MVGGTRPSPLPSAVPHTPAPSPAPLVSQAQEARLPHMLKLLVWMQERLQQRVNFPAMHDLLTAELALPDTEMAS